MYLLFQQNRIIYWRFHVWVPSRSSWLSLHLLKGHTQLILCSTLCRLCSSSISRPPRCFLPPGGPSVPKWISMATFDHINILILLCLIIKPWTGRFNFLRLRVWNSCLCWIPAVWFEDENRLSRCLLQFVADVTSGWFISLFFFFLAPLWHPCGMSHAKFSILSELNQWNILSFTQM